MNKLICILWLIVGVVPAIAQNRIGALTCEYRENPLGVEPARPKLSWKLFHTSFNVAQKAYQLVVADNMGDIQKNIGNIWDSKKIVSAQSLQVSYAGAKLLSGRTYYWKVRVWDNQNKAYWSGISKWQMGLREPEDWKGAHWIAYEKLPDPDRDVLPTDGKKDRFYQNNLLPIFRKDFQITRPVKKATLFISGLGHFEASINGEKIGDHFLDPGWTKYDKEALYVTFDVTGQLKNGGNALGVMLGNGFYYIPPVKGRYRKLKVAFGYPKMICRLFIEYRDGTTANVVSNAQWKTAPSPITFSSIYGGEDYNANLLQVGWNQPGFDGRNWKSAILVDGPALSSQKEDPVKVMQTFVPRQINSGGNGEWVYDLGQNASGIIELKVKGKQGDTIRVTPAELLRTDGAADQRPSGSPMYFTYILKGDGLETWRPRFTYYGFRYLQVKNGVPLGIDNPMQSPVIHQLTGLHIRNAAQTVGTFECSNTLFNQTFDLINWAIKSNMVSLFTDCPHREKLGWLEELHLMGSSVRYNFDVAPLFRKSLADMQHSQTKDGLIPEIAPEYVKFEWGGDMFRDSPEWGSSGILMAWYLYQWYGDREVLTTYYPMMQRYMAYLGTRAQEHILSQGLGDWYDLGPKPPGVSQLTPKGITATAIYYHDLEVMGRIAVLLGKNNDASHYQKLASKVYKAFNSKFFNIGSKQYGSGSQTANAMAIVAGLVPNQYANAVLANLIRDIRERNNSLTAGDIGYRYVLRALENAGRSDVIFEMNSRSDVPGYGLQLAKGATALTESWAALPTVSNNHFMLGHLMEWFYSGVGGIRQAEGSIAFKHIKICPETVGDLNYAKASYNSPYGRIVSNWRKDANGFDFEIVIPANTRATIYLPLKGKQQIISTNKAPFRRTGSENGRAIIEIGSGTYQFRSE